MCVGEMSGRGGGYRLTAGWCSVTTEAQCGNSQTETQHMQHKLPLVLYMQTHH